MRSCPLRGSALRGREKLPFPLGAGLAPPLSEISRARAVVNLLKVLGMINERTLRRTLIVIALAALAIGLATAFAGHQGAARRIWAAGTIPVVLALAISIVRDILAGRMGVDAIAFLSMAAALALGQTFAGVVVAIMYAGGNVLEDYAVGRAERDLKSLVDRAPRVAHRRTGVSFEDVPIEQISIGDMILVRAGEVIPVDGLITRQGALLDESAVTGEPIPVTRRAGETARSGAVNAGETLEIQASAIASESTYAGIVRMVTAAQTAKAPFIRMADRYALVLLPATLLVAGAAWLFSHDPVRGLAVLVAATPCPLILAAPVAFIAGTAQAARRRHPDQRWRASGGTRTHVHGDVRQDGHANGRRSEVGRRRTGSRRRPR
jgi:cation transport ATPase